MRAILFDLDGTLIDSTEAILDGFFYTFDRFNLPRPPKERILSLVGHPLDFMFVHLGVQGDIEAFVRSYKERYKEVFKEKTTLLPGAKEAIQRAKSFAKLGVVTTKTGSYSKELLDYLGVGGYFEVVIGREDVHHPKPHPEPILKALHKMQTPKEHTYFIGDTCLDGVAARDGGVVGVGVLCGYGEPKELSRCFIHLCRDSAEAVELIWRMERYDG